MKIFKTTIFFLFIFSMKIYGQVDSLNFGTPVSITQDVPVSWVYLDTVVSTGTNFRMNSNFRTALSSHSLPNYDNTALKNYADSVKSSCTACGFSKYYGYGIENTVNFKSSAQYYNPHIAGGKLWIMRITSTSALGLQFYFSKFMIPNKSFLHIYTQDRRAKLGPYTSKNTPSDSTQGIHFGTSPIFSNDVFVEYYESDSANYTGSIEFTNIIHMFTQSFGGAADCQTDVACPGGTGWESEIASTALILIYNSSNTLMGTCSGNLLSNTQNVSSTTDPIPYFLTAGHCLYTPAGSAYSVSTWHFVFDYQSCCNDNGTDPGFQKVIYGATLLNSDNMHKCTTSDDEFGTSDYLFLKLNSPTTQSLRDWGVCFAGWEVEVPFASGIFSSSDIFTLIHHPQGDVMKICEGDNLLIPISSPACPSNASYKWDSQYFYNIDFLNTTSGGAPEQGSSGAGLFNGDHRIIGTVTGSDYDFIQPCVSNVNQTQGATSDPVNYYIARFTEQFPHFKYTDYSTGFPVTKNYLDPNGDIYDYTANSGAGDYTGATISSVNSFCPNSNGPLLVDCTINGDPNGGTGGSACTGFVNHYNLSDGIKINGLGGLPVLCPTDDITFTALCGSPVTSGVGWAYYSRLWITAPYDNYTDPGGNPPCGFASGKGGPDGGFSINCFNTAWNVFGICSGCYYRQGSYQVYITECDYNFQPIGPTHTKVYSVNAYQASEVSKQSQWTYGYYSLSFHPSQLGISLQSGHFYSIFLGSGDQLGASWAGSGRTVYITGSPITVNNQTIGSGVFGTGDITLQQVTVAADIDVSASNSIDIKGEPTDLLDGHYYISPINCNTAHREESPNQNTPKNNNASNSVKPAPAIYQTNSSVVNPEKKVFNSGLLIYPNPVTNNAIIELTTNNFKQGDYAVITVYNSMGQIVKNERVNITTNIFQTSMNVDELNDGMYSVIVSAGIKRWQSKFVKQ